MTKAQIMETVPYGIYHFSLLDLIEGQLNSRSTDIFRQLF